MSLINEIWRPLKRSMLTIVGTFLLLYLIFHILQGERGLLSYPERTRVLEQKKSKLAGLTEEELIWKRRVALLQRDKGVDLDMLEERARVMLNYTRPDEVVILHKPD